MMWITPLLVSTSAAVPVTSFTVILPSANVTVQLRAPQASHLPFSCLRVSAHSLSPRDDMELQDVCQSLACKELLRGDAERFQGC